MTKRICDEPECERPHLAKGLCRMHYRRANPTAKNNAVTCPTCGTVTMKRDKDRRFCSLVCRDIWRIDQPNDPMYRKTARGVPGKRICRLPADHPAMWAGRSTPVTFGPCGWCGATTCRGQAGLRAYCTPSCRRKARTQRRRAREQHDYRTWCWSDFMHIARRFNYRCAYCNTKPDHQLQPDHVIALSKSGPNSVNNLLPSCLSCNASKSDLSLDEWDARRERLNLPPRITTWASEDSRYYHLTAPQIAVAA
jgi:hypothetical protein